MPVSHENMVNIGVECVGFVYTYSF